MYITSTLTFVVQVNTETLARLQQVMRPVVVVGVVDGRDAFLRHLGVLGISLGTRLTIAKRHAFDGSLEVTYSDGEEAQMLSPSVCARLWVDQSNPEPVIAFPEED